MQTCPRDLHIFPPQPSPLLQNKKYKKQGLNTGKDGEREQM